MKKRFTVMLNTSTIKLIKALYDYYSPSGVRKELETIICNYAIEELTYHNSNKLTETIKKDEK